MYKQFIQSWIIPPFYYNNKTDVTKQLSIVLSSLMNSIEDGKRSLKKQVPRFFYCLTRLDNKEKKIDRTKRMVAEGRWGSHVLWKEKRFLKKKGIEKRNAVIAFVCRKKSKTKGYCIKAICALNDKKKWHYFKHCNTK